MKNSQKYKTAKERAKAFSSFCDVRICEKCEMKELSEGYPVDCCLAFWLDLEVEKEEILPCPFCGRDTVLFHRIDGMNGVYCTDSLHCNYESGLSDNESEAIAAHNLVAKAVMDAKKKGAEE